MVESRTQSVNIGLGAYLLFVTGFSLLRRSIATRPDTRLGSAHLRGAEINENRFPFLRNQNIARLDIKMAHMMAMHALQPGKEFQKHFYQLRFGKLPFPHYFSQRSTLYIRHHEIGCIILPEIIVYFNHIGVLQSGYISRLPQKRLQRPGIR